MFAQSYPTTAIRWYVLLAWLWLAPPALAQVNCSWLGGVGNWSNASGWNPAGAPNNGSGGNNYNVTINTGTVTLDIPVTIEALNLTGGLNVTQNLTINGLFTWNNGGGLFGTSAVTANGGLTVTGLGPPSLGTTLTSSGLAAVTRSLLGNTGAVWNNTATGVVELSSGAGLAVNSGTPVFNNAGILRKLPGSTSTITWQVNNAATGTIQVQGGNLELNNGGTWATGTTLNVLAGGSLVLAGGAFTLGNTTANNNGVVQFFTNSGVTVNGTYTHTGTGITAVNRVVTFNGTTQLGNASLYGTWGGSGNATISGLFTWNGGTMSGAGVTTANGGVNLTVSNLDSATLSRRFVNNGTATVTGPVGLSGAAGGIWENPVGAVLNVAGNINMTATGAPQLLNSGTVQKTAGSTSAVMEWILTNAAGSTLNVQAGTWSWTGGGTIAASTLSASANATLSLDSTFALNSGAVFTGPGLLRIGGTTTVSAGTLQVDGPLRLAGTLTGAGAVNVTGQLNFNGNAALSTSGAVAANGGVLVDGLNTSSLQTTLNVSGTSTLTRGFFGQTPAIWNQLAGSTLDIPSDGGLAVTSGLPIFNNSGTVVKSAVAGGFTNLAWQFNQSATGVVQSQVGLLSLTGGGTLANGSSVQVAGGATVGFDGGAFSLGSVNFTNTGVVRLAGMVTANQNLTIGATTQLTGGTTTLNGTSSSLATFSQSSGTLTGPGNLSVSGVWTWTGGTHTGGGTTTANGGINLTGSNTMTLGRTVVNTGTTTLANTVVLQATTGAAWSNAVGSVFDLQSSNQLTIAGGAPVAIFSNAGTVSKPLSAAGATINWQLNQSSTGLLDVQVGTLTLAGGGAFTAGSTTTIANGAALHLAAGTFTLPSGNTLTSAGLLRFGGSGATTTWAGTLNHTGSTDVLGGTTSFNTGPYTLTTVSHTGGTWRGSANVTLTGQYAWSAGALEGGGGTTTANGGIALTPGSVGITLARTLVNTGTATFAGTGNLIGNPGAVWTNQAGALFDLTVDRSLTVNAGLPAPQFTNAGTFRKSAGTGAATIAWNFTNTGQVQAQTGTLNFSAGLANTGTVTVSGAATVGGTVTSTSTGRVTGTGTLSGSVVLNAGGTLAPGTPTTIGTLTVGSSTITNGSFAWKVENAGPNNANFAAINNTATSSTGAGVQDVLSVTGNVVWSNVTIELIGLSGNGFDPTKAYSWRLANYGGTGSVTGFVVNTTNFSPQPFSQFTISTITNTVILNYNPVPEPGSILTLAGLGGGLLAIWRQRRRAATSRAACPR
jgi:hypothetical protein